MDEEFKASCPCKLFFLGENRSEIFKKKESQIVLITLITKVLYSFMLYPQEVPRTRGLREEKVLYT